MLKCAAISDKENRLGVQRPKVLEHRKASVTTQIVNRSELTKSWSVHICLLSCCTLVCHCQVTVAFHCSLSLLDHADQLDEEVHPGVTLIQSAAGERKLRFEQNLLIHYSSSSLQVRDWSEKSGIKGERRKMNNTVWLFDQINFLSSSVQTVPLCAHLLLATIRLSTDSVNFGFCYVGQTHRKEVNLYSQGAHTHWTSLLGTEAVFCVHSLWGLFWSSINVITHTALWTGSYYIHIYLAYLIIFCSSMKMSKSFSLLWTVWSFYKVC